MSALKANVQMHFCVLVWGFTAVLGKLISLTALNLVVWRMALTTVILWLMCVLVSWTSLAKAVRQTSLAKAARQTSLAKSVRLRDRETGQSVRGKEWGLVILTGALIALHWLAFYASVKLSNASIGVVCIAFAPIFSVLLTPWLGSHTPNGPAERFSWRNLLLSLSVLPGMLLVVGGVRPGFYLGIAMGALSALLIALFSLYNKRLVARFEVLPLSFWQIAIGCSILLPFAALNGISLPAQHDWLWLVVFAGVCTAVPFALASQALRQMSAFSAQFTVNLEPIYGICFAAWFLNETAQLSRQFYLGAALIVAAVFAQAALNVRDRSERID